MKSKDSKKNDPRPESQAIERAILATVGEIHMGQYPIFCITTEKASDTRMTYREKFKAGNVDVLKEWSIQISGYYGWPGEHEAEVWRAIQHIAELRRRAGNLANPIQTTLEEIREYMSSKSKGGRQWKAILRSLHCLCDTRLETNYWYNTEIKLHQNAVFCVVSSIAFDKQKLPNGKEINGKVYIGLEPRLFINIQNGYVRPVDKGFLDTKLDRWLAKRLYELLGPKFFGLRKKGVPYRTRYSRLCGLLGNKRQHYLSDARNILKPSHKELQEQGFLSKVEWFPIMDEKKDWVMHYWPGPRAKAEWKKEFWWKGVEIREALYIEELPLTAAEPIYVEEPPDESTITVDVVTDEPPEPLKQLPIFVEEPPDFIVPEPDKPPVRTAKPLLIQPKPFKAAKTAPVKPIITIEPVPESPQPEEDSYAKEAILAFETASGKHRRLAKLSAAEQKRLVEWKTLDVIPSDIEAGTNVAMAKALERSRESGSPPQEIVSLAYINGYVLDAAKKRQAMKRFIDSATKQARAFQSQELREMEAQLKEKLQNKPSLKPFYREFIEPLILVTAQSDYAVMTSPVQDCSSLFLNQGWRLELMEAFGFAAFVTWVVEWAHGPGWRNALGSA